MCVYIREVFSNMNKWIRWIIKISKIYRKRPDLVSLVIDSDEPDRVIDDFYSEKEKKLIDDLINQKELLKLEIEELKAKIPLSHPKEEYYNNKYPKIPIFYRRIEADDTYNIDVRNYFQIRDSKLPKIKGNSDDEIALNCLKWVIDNITYASDKTHYGYDEFWAYPYQTLKRRRGDCEDGAILLANMMIKSGIPYWKVRLCAGTVYKKNGSEAGGHAYLTYYCEEEDDWKTLDWCYYPNKKEIKYRPNYKNEAIYGNGEVWFSWNMKYCFADSTALKIEIENRHLTNINL